MSTALAEHKIVSQKEWTAARMELLAAEKVHTRQSDELAQRRQALPWVKIEKEYSFETDAGKASLADLFCGRSQLVIYHFMFGPDYTAGCPSCSSIADSFNGVAVHLANHDVMFGAVSRAPLPKLQAYKKRMGWSFPWASSHGSDFNFDFHASHTLEQVKSGTMDYNYRTMDLRPAIKPGEENPSIAGNAASTGTDATNYMKETPGMSSFVLRDGVVYHTYSAYSRGLDGLWNMYQWLDRAPLGRNETGIWFRRHDEYGQAQAGEGSCCSAGKGK